MSKLHTLQRLERARARLRDVAAAKHTLSTQRVEERRQEVATAKEALETYLDTPPVDAPHVGALQTYDDGRRWSLGRVMRAHHETRLAEKEATTTAAELRVREQALRSIERQIALVRRERAKRAQRADQVLVDDLSGRRGR